MRVREDLDRQTGGGAPGWRNCIGKGGEGQMTARQFEGSEQLAGWTGRLLLRMVAKGWLERPGKLWGPWDQEEDASL